MGIIDDDAPKRRRVGLVYDDRMCKHSDPDYDDHPENPDRIRAIWDRLNVSGLAQRCIVLNPKKAKESHLALVHSKEHIKLIKTISSSDSVTRSDAASKLDSIYFNEGSSEASHLAAGSVIKAAEEVGKGELDYAFAIVRPPGHHAEEDEAMGFCLYNNVAVAASFLLNRRPQFGIGKILIVDWDVHHGNGTQKMFYRDPRVLVFSVHRHDSGRFYPFGNDGSYNMTGEGPGAGYNINVPWENGGYGDADYFAVWDQILIPVAKEFNPDIILISAGFDAALGDPIGGCCLSPYGYSIMLDKLMDIGRGKIVMALEGGYDPVSLVSSAQACVEVFLQDRPIIRSWDGLPLKSTELVIQAVRQALSKYWPVLGAKSPDKVSNSRPSQTEDIADVSGASVQANSIVEPVHVADKQIDPEPETGVVGSPPRPTEIELQPPGLPEAPTIETEESLISRKGKRPKNHSSGKRPRVTMEEPALERSLRDNFALPRDKETVSKMSHDKQTDQITYYTAKVKNMQEKMYQQRKEIEALKADIEEEQVRALEKVKSLKATCQSLESRAEEVEKEVARANQKLMRLVKKKKKKNKKKKKPKRNEIETEMKHVEDEIKNLQDEHARVGSELAEAYHKRLMYKYAHKWPPFILHYILAAIKTCQRQISAMGSDIVLDMDSILNQVPSYKEGLARHRAS